MCTSPFSKSVTRCLLVICGILLLSACVKQEDLLILEKKISKQEEALTAMRQDLGETSKEVETVRPEQADMWSEVQAMKRDLAEMLGRVEDLQANVTALSDESPQMRQEIEKLQEATSTLDSGLRQLASEMAVDLEIYRNKPEDATAEGSAPAGKEDDSATITADNGNDQVADTPASGTASSDQASTDDETAETLYTAALNAFKERRYDDAERMWSEFEKTFPKHNLVSNAVFWQGEALYQAGNYGKSALAYQRVIDTYPDSNKYLSSMYKQGMAFIRIGNEKAAKIRLNTLIKKHPESKEAQRAKIQLEKLN